MGPINCAPNPINKFQQNMLIFLLGANRPGAKRLGGRNDQRRNDLGRNAAGAKRLGGELDLGRNDPDSLLRYGSVPLAWEVRDTDPYPRLGIPETVYNNRT